MQSKTFSEASKIRQIHFSEVVKRLLCGEVTGTVFVIGVVIKVSCDKRGVLKVRWECTYPTDPIIGE